VSNPESYAICKSDLIIKGQDPAGIAFGNSFSEDGHPSKTFDYCISNPPFGVEWKNVEKEVSDEHEKKGTAGRFGAGLPRISDGSLLFVQHMISKFRKDGNGSRLAVVLNGSPLFSGGAGSGESEIRRWIIENDWLEAIIGLPDQLFYNTGISTYIWIITSQKAKHRRGKVQLIDATAMFEKMRKSLGNKRNLIPENAITELTRIFGDMSESEVSKIFDNEDFGYHRITVERPLRKSYEITLPRSLDVAGSVNILFPPSIKNPQNALNVINEVTIGDIQKRLADVFKSVGIGKVYMSREEFSTQMRSAFKLHDLHFVPAVASWVIESFGTINPEAEPCMKGKKIEPDPELRDTEIVPLKEDIQRYFEREVLPHVPDAWIDEDKTRRGYEIPFTRHFYKFETPRSLAAIDADLQRLSSEIQEMLREIAA
jgi:type I restriction enzyme M protein